MSRSMDLILLIWVPILRWMPEHRMHRKTPLNKKEIILFVHRQFHQNIHIPRSPPGVYIQRAMDRQVVLKSWVSKMLTISFAIRTDFVIRPFHKLT